MSTFLDVIAEHNLPDKDIGRLRKMYLSTLLTLVECPEVIAVIGLRRSGKSTIIQQLQNSLIQSGTSRDHTIYINFEDPRLEEIANGTQLLHLVQEICTAKLGSERIYLFLDELDHIGSWEKAINFLYENQKRIKLFISGSNSSLFTGRLATVMSGRYIPFRVYPLCFAEYLDFTPFQRSDLDALKDFLEWGGFPRVVVEKNTYVKNQVLSSYFQTIVEKDLIVRHKIRKVQELRELVKYVFLNPTRIFSSYNLSKVLDVEDSTVNRYLSYMEQAYIIHRLPLYSPSVKKQIYNPDKILLSDNGLARIAGFSGGDNFGQRLENSCGLELIRRTEGELFYWKDDCDVDFVSRRGASAHFYNVTTSVDDDTTYKREVQSLDKARLSYPAATFSLLTLINSLHREDPRIEQIYEFMKKSQAK